MALPAALLHLSAGLANGSMPKEPGLRGFGSAHWGIAQMGFARLLAIVALSNCVIAVRLRTLLRGGKPEIRCVTEVASNMLCSATVQNRIDATKIRIPFKKS